MTKQVGKAGTEKPNRLPPLGSPRGKSGGDDLHHAPSDGANTEPYEIPCRKVRPLLRKFHRGELITDPDLYLAIDRHIDHCQECYLKLLRFEVVTDSNHMADVMIGLGQGEAINMRHA